MEDRSGGRLLGHDLRVFPSSPYFIPWFPIGFQEILVMIADTMLDELVSGSLNTEPVLDVSAPMILYPAFLLPGIAGCFHSAGALNRLKVPQPQSPLLSETLGH